MRAPLPFLALFLGTASPAMAAVTLTPTEDDFTMTANPSNNYGGAGAILVSASALPKGGFSGVMQFDFSTAKSTLDATYGVGGWTAQSVTITLNFQSPNNGIFNSPAAAGSFNATWFDGSWTEGIGTPAAPTTTGMNNTQLASFLAGTTSNVGTFSYGGATTGTATYTFTLTPALLADLMSGSTGDVAFTAADSAINMVFNSKSGAVAPLLTINATPEPGRALLLALGALCMVGRRRRTSVFTA